VDHNNSLRGRRKPVEFFQEKPSLEDLNQLLKPIKDATNLFQSNDVTACSVFWKLGKMITDIQQYTGIEFRDLQNGLLTECKNRLHVYGSDEAFLFASLLDPRQKRFVFEETFREKYADFLRIPCYDFIREKFVKELNSTIYDNSGSVRPSQEKRRRNETVVNAFQDELMSFMNVEQNPPTDGADHVPDELSTYMSETLSRMEPLRFWKANESKFPRLAAAARRFLAVPASSSDVERLFSIAGALQRARRARLNCSTIEDLLLYRDYRLAEILRTEKVCVRSAVDVDAEC
jgi:hypothetical protein